MGSMFKVGDVVELDLDSDINGALNGYQPDELKWLSGEGIIPNKQYKVEEVLLDASPNESPIFLLLFDGVFLKFCEERFKLVAPFSLENE